MNALYENGFSVPEPIDHSRHMIVMSLIEGFPMRQLTAHSNPAQLYSTLMDFIVRLANNGLIHGDFNEFNVMIREKFDDPADEIVVIDFPQCVSLSHVDAQRYFERDVDCIRSFFEKKLNYISESYPRFDRDVSRVGKLDIQVEASGFSKKQVKDLEEAMELSRQQDEAEIVANYDEEEEEEEEEEEDEEEDEVESEDEKAGSQTVDEQERINAEIRRVGIENMKMDKLGNYILDSEV